MIWHWCKQTLVAIDQFANALSGGWADETLSSRLWRKRERPGWKQARAALDFIDHCRASYESEVRRLQCPPEMRN